MVTLMAGGAVENLGKLDTGSVDLILTSPPYNIHFNYEVYDDFLPWPDYYEWCDEWLTECYRVLADDGRMLLNHRFSMGNSKDGMSYPLMHLNEIMVGIGFQHKSVVFWEDVTIAKRTAWGSWLSASAPYICSPYEGILVMYKYEWKKKKKGITKISKKEFMEGCLGVWKISPVKGKRRNHPAPFPIGLAERSVLLFSYEGDTVLDPFVGSGTTVVAADRHNRKGIGIDLNPRYIEAAKDWVLEDRDER